MRVIAIDGPAGAGKSTIGRRVATALGLDYLDTGAMYRAVAYGAIQLGIDLGESEAVAGFAERATLSVDDDGVFIDGLDATIAIRTAEVTAAVAPVASNPAVRRELVRRQRQWAMERGGGVLEGRDIGTVVFPDAALKVYLTASPLERATRRAAQSGGDIGEIAAAIAERDRSDSTRSASPLRAADSAVEVDTTGRSVEEIVEEIIMMLETNERGMRST